MKGYKGTNQNMTCRGHKFELGVWYEAKGPLELCGNGFHFCEQPSGIWCFYPSGRMFEVEAEEVSEEGKDEPGASRKRVARRIRLVKEITPGGTENTGSYNTGDLNTGDRNTGYLNTGDLNTGDRNTGDLNTGDRNTGHRNTGSYNTGECNTGNLNAGNLNTGKYNTGNSNTGDSNIGSCNSGDYNTGHYNAGNYNAGNCNTGHYNTGHRNTGHRNTGDCNTGFGNATNNSSGFFCQEEQKVICFDVQTDLTRQQFQDRYPEYYDLCSKLTQDSPIDFDEFSRLPGITPEKLLSLHKKFQKKEK